MALLVNDPCDNFTLAPWTASGPTVVAGGRVGNCFNFPAGSSNRIKYTIVGGTTMLTVGIWVNLIPGGSLWTPLSFRGDAQASNFCDLILSAAGGLTVGTAGAPIGTAPAGTIPASTWTLIEMSCLLGGGSSGQVIVRVNGTPVITNLACNTKGTGAGAVYDGMWVQSVGGGISPWKADDIYIRNDLTFGTYPHVWPDANVPTTYAQTGAFEIGTLFTLTASISIVGVRIWNPGLGPHTGRSAKLWEMPGAIFISAGTKVREVTLPDTMPTGWSDWLFATPYPASTANYLVMSYDVGGSGVNDIGHVTWSTAVDSADGKVHIPASNPGCYTTTVDSCPAVLFINEFWGIDLLYAVAAPPVGVNAKVWNGSAFVDGAVKTWNGSAYVDAVGIKTWNGSAFV